MNEFSMSNNQLKFKTLGRTSTHHSRGVYRIHLKSIKKKHGGRQHVTESMIGENRHLVTNEPVEFEK